MSFLFQGNECNREFIMEQIVSQASPSWDMSHMLKSKTAKSLYYVLGLTPRVKEFDKHHNKFKNYNCEKSYHLCSNLLVRLKKNVKNTYVDCHVKFVQWEKDFVKSNQREPSSLDMDDSMLRIYYKTVHGRKLLKSWNMF